MSIASNASQRRTIWLLLLVATALLVVRCFTNSHYGFHRDELALFDDARDLAWGYVAYPPLAPALGHVSQAWFGNSLAGFRLFAALAQSVAVVFAGLVARALGGRRGAQLVAALATAFVPFSLVAGGLMQYVSIEYPAWVVLAWLLLRLIGSGNGRWWLAIGAVIGLGMLTKYTMLFCAVGIATGVLATPLRRQLATPWPWAGVAVSLLLFLPNALWQWQHDFISLDFMQSIHARDVRIGRTGGFLMEQLLGNAGPFLAPLWLLGMGWLAISAEAARWRVLAWMYGVPLLLLLLAQGRGYYLAPAYPMLLAAGAVAVEHWLSRRAIHPTHGRLVRGALGLALAATAVTGTLIGMQVSPINSPGWRFSRSAHDDFAEQVGWQELVAQVAAIHHALPPEERAHAGIFANNYGEAGAIDLYGPHHGLPPAISPVNSYWYRGYGASPPTTVIVLGDTAEGIRDTPADCTLVGRVRNRYGVENEETRDHPQIFVCRNLRVPWAKLWPASPSFG